MAIRLRPHLEHLCGGAVEHHSGGMSPGGSGWYVCTGCGECGSIQSEAFCDRRSPRYESWLKRYKRELAQN